MSTSIFSSNLFYRLDLFSQAPLSDSTGLLSTFCSHVPLHEEWALPHVGTNASFTLEWFRRGLQLWACLSNNKYYSLVGHGFLRGEEDGLEPWWDSTVLAYVMIPQDPWEVPAPLERNRHLSQQNKPNMTLNSQQNICDLDYSPIGSPQTLNKLESFGCPIQTPQIHYEKWFIILCEIMETCCSWKECPLFL